MERKDVRPDVPLGGEVRDVEVVDAAPADVGEVLGDHGLVERGVEFSVHDLRQPALCLGP